MKNSGMDRKEFLESLGRWGACSCLCAAVGGLPKLLAQEAPKASAPPAPGERAIKRMEFAESWLPRFFSVLDSTLDKETRKKVMMANGRACFQGWIKSTGRPVKPTTLEQLAAWAEQNAKDDSIRVEGKVIYFQFTAAAETGQPAAEGACLCPLAETKPAGLSGTYCLCSLGYVKEWYDQMLQKSVDVELVDSVLRGGKRCQFKITVA